MPIKTLWIDLKFEFDTPAEDYPKLIKRLENCPSLIENLIGDIPANILTKRKDDKWSIQEHIGHLMIIEPLFLGRLDDFEAGLKVLRPADMSNKSTNDANLNESDIKIIMNELKKARSELIKRLKELPAEMFSKTALHPRLNEPMRLVDSMYFEAEHDDHHIKWIEDLVGEMG